MAVMEQNLINVLLGGLSVIIGAVISTIYNSVKELERTDKDINEKLSAIEVAVAGNYVKRDEFINTIERLFTKLDSIDQKLDAKADK